MANPLRKTLNYRDFIAEILDDVYEVQLSDIKSLRAIEDIQEKLEKALVMIEPKEWTVKKEKARIFIKERRIQLKISQVEMAKHLGLKFNSAYRDIETGRVKLRVDRLILIADKLDLSIHIDTSDKKHYRFQEQMVKVKVSEGGKLNYFRTINI